MVQTLTSAAGVISLLDETNEELQIYALKQLDVMVDQFWAEIADEVTKIEILYENEAFKERKLAALVASKVYFHLGELEDSLTFALGAGDLFESTANKKEYIETIISKAIDTYIALKNEDPEASAIDPRLEAVVEAVFKRCYADGEFKQAIGIALESLRLDVLEATIVKGNAQKELLSYILEAAITIVQHIDFRNKVLRLLVKLYGNLEEPDFFATSKCYLYLNDHAKIAELLEGLVKKDEYHALLAYQIAFDLESNTTQEFLTKVIDELPAGAGLSESVAATPAVSDAMDTDEATPLVSAGPSTTVEDPHAKAFSKIRTILTGELSIRLHLEFLSRNNHSDLLILKKTKENLESRSAVYHQAITVANAYMNAGTTSDDFLRQNLEWLAKATNWTKFIATAALGVIHKGQISVGMALLGPYLPKEGVTSSAYSEGGSLFALGLIHANHGAGVLDYLTNALKATQSETIQHGACLGLGVAGMATGSESIYEDLKNVMFSDSAVAGEAAGLAIGLVMLGTSNGRVIEEILQYAHETQHEKIIRGIAVGVALIMYGKEENADALIEELLQDKDPILRYSGIYTVAMAYSGTGNNKAIKKLLHVAVSDVNDDVRRAAVTSLGFVLFRTPSQVPRVVQLLSESFNPHVRYGATLALGISCAGTALTEALDLLEPMTKDNVDFVRQGALIAQAMILVQQNEASSSRVEAVRKQYETIIADKHEDVMAVFGAVLGQGILDAGGRNVSISLRSPSGLPNMSAIVGMAVFTQFWYWYPLTHFMSLAFTPTGIIGLNKQLEVPKFDFVSNAKPSLFAYPPPIKPPETKEVEKVATAVLSTTARAMARAKKAKAEDAMDTDEKKDVPPETPKDEKAEAEKAEKEKKKKKEPSFEVLENLARVLPSQLKYISFKENSRYVPVKKELTGGILIMNDKKPNEPEDIIALGSAGQKSTAAASSTSAAPPTSATSEAPPSETTA
ncbi:proteasome regulatory particle base subunit [Phlyctochytrium planicorne]|nr:proteasome regulatory particle base subunit [Phlyctochytrium planicorne]